MQTRVKSDITTSKRGSLFKEKDSSKNNASNFSTKTVTQHSKYVEKHLNHNLIPGMVSFYDDSDYMDAISNY
jgi:hypothetical protein